MRLEIEGELPLVADREQVHRALDVRVQQQVMLHHVFAKLTVACERVDLQAQAFDGAA